MYQPGDAVEAFSIQAVQILLAHMKKHLQKWAVCKHIGRRTTSWPDEGNVADNTKFSPFDLCFVLFHWPGLLTSVFWMRKCLQAPSHFTESTWLGFSWLFLTKKSPSFFSSCCTSSLGMAPWYQSCCPRGQSISSTGLWTGGTCRQEKSARSDSG